MRRNHQYDGIAQLGRAVYVNTIYFFLHRAGAAPCLRHADDESFNLDPTAESRFNATTLLSLTHSLNPSTMLHNAFLESVKVYCYCIHLN